MLYFHGDRTIDVEVLVGCFWTVRRKALDQFGLLDEGFFIYAEDVDWCMRCRKAGWRVVFYSDIQAIHYRGVSTVKKDPIRFSITQQQSVLRFWGKHHGPWGRFSIRLLIFAGTFVRLLATSVSYLMRPGSRAESRIKLSVSQACLRNLLFGTRP
jgi:hypothetical protein